MTKANKRTRKNQRHTEKKIEVTFSGLNRWFRKLFEELGWMVLAKDMGFNDKIQVYKSSIKRFIEAAENAKEEIKEDDRCRDITIMLEKIKVLQNHVNKDFH
jgi:hypothetical protein